MTAAVIIRGPAPTGGVIRTESARVTGIAATTVAEAIGAIAMAGLRDRMCETATTGVPLAAIVAATAAGCRTTAEKQPEASASADKQKGAAV
jgi:hypothetical protein